MIPVRSPAFVFVDALDPVGHFVELAADTFLLILILGGIDCGHLMISFIILNFFKAWVGISYLYVVK
jgi:hypothetical protein